VFDIRFVLTAAVETSIFLTACAHSSLSFVFYLHLFIFSFRKLFSSFSSHLGVRFAQYWCLVCRSQWPRGLWHEISSPARTLRSRIFIFLLLLFLVGETESTWYCCHYWPIVPAPDDKWWWLWSNWWNEDCAGETEALGENLPQRHFVHHKSHMTRPAAAVGSWVRIALKTWMSVCVYSVFVYR
jgi:hypothetical protein